MRHLLQLDEDGKISIPAHIRRVKLDVGLSYTAPMSWNWLNQNGHDLLVFGFEANSSVIGGIDKHPNFRIINCVLSSTRGDGVCDFYITRGDMGCSSKYVPNSALLQVDRVVRVDQCTLSEFFELFPFDRIPYIEYIKVDAQGSDLDILKGAGEYLKEHVVYVTAEPEDLYYENTCNSVEEMDKYMISLGFERITTPNTWDPTYLNPKWKHVADSIYIFQKG